MKLLIRAACDSSLSSAEKGMAILLLVKYGNHKYGYAWPSRKTLATDLGVAVSTVTRAIYRLEARGYFAVQQNKGRGHTNRYVPLFDGQEKGAPARPFRGEEKGASMHLKGRKPRTQKGASVQQEPTTEPTKEPSTGFAALTSPPEGGSRRSPETSSQQASGAGSEAPQSDPPGRDNGPMLGKPNRADADAGGNQEPPSPKPPKLSTVLNRNRAPMKEPSYWKERERSKRAEKMTGKERERFWLEQMDEEEPEPPSRPSATDRRGA